MYPVTDAHMVDIFELQIDDLVGKAIRHKATSKNDIKEIELFANVLSEMQNSLKVNALNLCSFCCIIFFSHDMSIFHCSETAAVGSQIPAIYFKFFVEV